MVKRNKTRKINVGGVQIGGQNKVVIQSMTNTKTKDIKSTVEQITKLEEAGCEIIRVACLDIEDAKAIKEIKKNIHIPIVSDIHFDYRIALEAAKSGLLKFLYASNRFLPFLLLLVFLHILLKYLLA